MDESNTGAFAPETAGAGAPDTGDPARNGASRPPDTGPGDRAAAAAPGAPKPRIGDTRPAPVVRRPAPKPPLTARAEPDGGGEDGATETVAGPDPARRSRSRRRGGRERRGRSVGRYLMCVHVRPHVTQIAVLEGRSLVEHYVSRGADETTQIDGNIYWGRVQNVLPGMEAAFIDIGIPKNAVLYRGDVRYDRDDVEASSDQPRIEDVLRPGQTILCQVTKNPIGTKGARLTQEVSLPGRFAVLVPNSSTFGISKRLGDNERRRLRRIVDEIRPEGHGLIIRTAAEGATADELRRDVASLLEQWSAIEAEARRTNQPRLLYREPDQAVRILREELNADYRAVIIDDEALFRQVRDYYDPAEEPLPIFERFHVHEQLHKALDRKVWLPSGGSLIIERTEALTVIDVNTGKNVGKTNLEETVYRNNLEAAEEVARQLRLRDIGGIIVIDFIDMEIRENRDKVSAALRAALARDKTRTQVSDISELGLVEMTRKRISEGLLESMSTVCEVCAGRGIVLDSSAL
jgi:ribonuclease E